MRHALALALCPCLALAACGTTDTTAATDGGGGHDAAAAGDAARDGGAVDGTAYGSDAPAPFFGKVYAHSDTDLYEVDPDTLGVSHVAKFQFADSSEQMTDIAIDDVGNMVGISFGNVYRVDKTTGACTKLAALDREFNGLTFIPGDEIGGGQAILVGAANDGTVWKVDPTTGHSTQIGAYGNGWQSSGDLVSVSGFGTVATVNQGLGGTDWLAKVDPTTGVATPIFDTGISQIWGLGFWKGQVYGFTADGTFVLLDPVAKTAHVQQTGSVLWWGAGVTTEAPVIG
jgi:hypothetical protein